MLSEKKNVYINFNIKHIITSNVCLKNNLYDRKKNCNLVNICYLDLVKKTNFKSSIMVSLNSRCTEF